MLAESGNVAALLECLRRQRCRDFSLYCCVNNVEGGYGYDDNQATLRLLAQVHDLPLTVIDRSSEGMGWSGKQRGVGWARKLLFERIVADAGDDELVVSLDADTDFDDNYLTAVLATCNANPTASAFSVPYYHPLSGDAEQDRAMLRYECYMRRYRQQLQRIGSPYAFTALGSAMAFPLWAYRRVGGITPLQGGEDFYLLQKFAKTGTLVQQFAEPWHSRHMAVRPQGRVSSRVPFGTGPAIARGVADMAAHYPFYTDEAFALVRATYEVFPALYDGDVETPMSAFLRRQLATDDPWSPLRRNFRRRDLFVHACTERVDGLRILQFLKSDPAFLLPDNQLPVDFIHDDIPTLNRYRDSLL